MFGQFQDQLQSLINVYVQDGDPTQVVELLETQEKKRKEGNDFKVLVESIFKKTLLNLSCEDEINFQQFEWLLQLSILFARDNSSFCSLPTIIMSELFDCRTIEECESLFSLIDNNVNVWKEEIFFKNVKNMLLRLCNDLLRRLSRNQNTVFCGRILIFLANFFPLFERSGLNITSEFNQDNSTSYALQADDELSDNIIDIENKEGEYNDSNNFTIDYNFYKKFWQLQEYFRNPIICYTKSNYKSFQLYCNEVLSVFSGYKIDPNSCCYFQSLGLDSDDDKERNIYFVKYLTNQKLLELQLSDSNFRRHILIQILIIFQYFTTNVKSRNDAYILNEDQNNWINETKKKVNQLIEETPPNGSEVRTVIEHLLLREEYWNRWKNEGCNELKEVVETEEQQQQNADYVRNSYHSVNLARVGEKLRAHNNSNRIIIGNHEMTRLWNFCPDNLEACRSQKRAFTPSIERYFESVLKRPAKERFEYCSEPNFSWRALRLLSQKSSYFFVPSNQVVKPVNDYLQGITERLAQEFNVVPNSIAEQEESKAETEDISDDELLKNVETNSVKSDDDMNTTTNTTPDTNDSNANESTLPDDILNETTLEHIAVKIADHWDELSPLFDFAEDELEFIKDNFNDPIARAKHLVTLWKEQNPARASLKNVQKIVQAVKPDINLF